MIRVYLWHSGNYYLFSNHGYADDYTLYICGDAPVSGTLDHIRNYLKDQLGEDYPAVLKDFYKEAEHA